MTDRIKLTEDKIHMINYHDDSITLKIDEVESIDYIRLKKQIIDDNVKVPKLESKLKMMEISFEQINNSRNDLIKELADCEMLNKQFKEKVEKIDELTNDWERVIVSAADASKLRKILGDKS